ncbi:MAG: purine-nucleoside phosphorylase [Coriobacteriia bacterium]
MSAQARGKEYGSLLPDIPETLAPFTGRARTALILGSGLSGLADRFEERMDVPFADISGFPQARAGVAGHQGVLSLATSSERSALVFLGRLHMYQGFTALEASYTARLAAALGCDTLIVTNAAGGVGDDLGPGDLMLISDHLNLTGDSPLRGWPGPEGGTPFVPMGGAYDPGLREVAEAVAAERGVELKEGVYAGLLGPQYETPAEVEMLRRLGAHAVGMSTVPEVIAARALGMRVLGLSLVTNTAGGSHLSHDEVLAAGERAASVLTELMLGILVRLES